MEFDVDLMYPLYHHQYQVKILVVDVVRHNLILTEIFVDEIFRGEKKVKNFSAFCYLLARRRIRFRAVDE
jgi:hypothetical protein